MKLHEQSEPNISQGPGPALGSLKLLHSSTLPGTLSATDPGFPRGGGANLLFNHFSRKLHENEEILHLCGYLCTYSYC